MGSKMTLRYIVVGKEDISYDEESDTYLVKVPAYYKKELKNTIQHTPFYETFNGKPFKGCHICSVDDMLVAWPCKFAEPVETP